MYYSQSKCERLIKNKYEIVVTTQKSAPSSDPFFYSPAESREFLLCGAIGKTGMKMT